MDPVLMPGPINYDILSLKYPDTINCLFQTIYDRGPDFFP